jgi:hypothetical protein
MTPTRPSLDKHCEEYLERLHALATRRRTSIEVTLDEARRIALPVMERRTAAEPRP